MLEVFIEQEKPSYDCLSNHRDAIAEDMHQFCYELILLRYL